MSVSTFPSTFPTPTKPTPQTSLRKKSTGRRPRILLVTPELGRSDFLARNGKHAPCVKAGGLADVSALLVDSLTEWGADVHVALPHFRSLYQPGENGHSRRLHLIKDREFSYRRAVYEGCSVSNLKASLAFQRDVIHYVLPRIRPDIIHCHDWMTGLVPAAARGMGIPSLFTLHNMHDVCTSLSHIEDRGIDAAGFWDHLYYLSFPADYESVRNSGAVSMLASGIHAADHMNTVSPSFLDEIASGRHGCSGALVDAVRGKLAAGCAGGIVNSLPRGIRPQSDPFLAEKYDAAGHAAGKLANKRVLQKTLGLEEDEEAPVLFWPSRLDPVQKGCQLLAEVLYRVVSDYWALGLQVVFVADGPFREHFERIRRFHSFGHRIAVSPFSEKLSRLGFAASDFTLMPSSYEPCGLAQMAGLRYGSLPIVHATGGLKDTVTPLDIVNRTGNGFVFEHHDANGLRWAIDEAIRFFLRPEAERASNITRIMAEAEQEFSPEVMAGEYAEIYRRLLKQR